MRRLTIAFALLALTACETKQDAGARANLPVTLLPDNVVLLPEPSPSPTPEPSATPVPGASPNATPAPTATPVVATPSPTPSPTPVALVKTSSYSGLDCSLRVDGKILCTNGTTSELTAMTDFVDVVVGASGVVCGLQRSYQYSYRVLPSRCFGTASCVNPPTYYETYCWAGFGATPKFMNTQNQIAPTVTYSQWISGPQQLTRDATTSKVCIGQTVAELGSSLRWHGEAERTTCGSIIDSRGWLL